ncbi:MAG: hypothetical protein GF320_12865 [Armatimonadia bacterium]|nr:hypothetical protein [Armatimonadia bacterium]
MSIAEERVMASDESTQAKPRFAVLRGELLRYLATAFVAASADTATLWLLAKQVGLHYQLAGIAGMVVGTTVNATLTRLWVFKTHRHTAAKEFILVWAISIAGMGWNALILYIGEEVLGVALLVAKAASLGLVFCWNFTMRRLTIPQRES